MATLGLRQKQDEIPMALGAETGTCDSSGALADVFLGGKCPCKRPHAMDAGPSSFERRPGGPLVEGPSNIVHMSGGHDEPYWLGAGRPKSVGHIRVVYTVPNVGSGIFAPLREDVLDRTAAALHHVPIRGAGKLATYLYVGEKKDDTTYGQVTYIQELPTAEKTASLQPVCPPPEDAAWWLHTYMARDADAIGALAIDVGIADAVPEPALRFVELVRDLPVVKHVAYAQDGDAHRIWSITEGYDVDAYDDIFRCELPLYDEWPGMEYDFFVLALEGRTVESALPDGFDVIWTRSG